MKKIIIPIAIFLAGLANAQLSQNENYVYTKTYLSDPDGSQPKVSETVQYVDGLGRPKQVISIKGSPGGKDIVTPVVYDAFGRQTRDYLPVPQSSTGNGAVYVQSPVPVDFPVGDPTGRYTNEKAFSEKLLENSPLDRLLEQKQIGAAWQSKPVKFEYGTNAAGDVRKYMAVSSTVENSTHSVLKVSGESNAENGYYKASQLYKNSVKDEDDNETIEFKNSKGQLVLVRKVLSALENADTYYIYNEYGQLAFVVPPKASFLLKTLVAGTQISDPVLNDLCYQYRYDGKGRVVEKKVPGKGWEEMVYNRADQLVLSRDVRLKNGIDGFTPAGSWIFSKYDKFGRQVYTGISIDTRPRHEIQAYVESISNAGYEERRFTVNLSGITAEYSNFSYPTTMSKLLTVTYYDKYPTLPAGVTIPATVMVPDQTVLPDTEGIARSTKSLSVASFVKNIEDDNWTKNFTWYDKKGRVIGTHSVNHLGGYTKMESELDFAGVAKQVKTYHKRLNTDTEKVITENFTYDSQNRLLVHKHQVNNNPEEILAQNTYNELSQLIGKKVGGISASSPLQDISYAYNIRGWMTKINDPKNLNGKLFGYEIKYNQVEGLETPDPLETDLKVKPKYNGNIAEVDWRTNTVQNDFLRRYGYVYDKLNRLSAGFYQRDDHPSANEYYEKMVYDLNGNITNLKRTASLDGNTTAGWIDNLAYGYFNGGNSNRLTSVIDSSTNYGGYPEVSGIPIPYDDNGNMISHEDKGILRIDYNVLNLPNKLKFDNTYIVRSLFGGTTETRNITTKYIFRADGTKISKLYSYGVARNQSETYKMTEYLDGFQYEMEGSSVGLPRVLKFVPTAEGYFDFVKNKYIYNYADHLGNTRLSYFNNGSSTEVLEESNYYPFGMKHEGYNPLAGNPSYQYKYNGKELQTESGMYDYGARFYMPDIGRWETHDPLSELQFSHSPYSYVYGNPIMFVDPTGMIGEDPDPKKVYGPKGGKLIEEVVIQAPLKPINTSLSFMGINNLDAYHASEDRLAIGIRGSKAALATEKFEKNLGFAMITFGMGGSNLLASASWATFDSYLSYQNEETQGAVGTVQLMAMLIQVSHGNAAGINKLINIGKQGKHIVGHNNYIVGKSILKEDAQLLLDAFHSGNIKSSRVINEAKVSVDFGKNIGDYVKDGIASPTTIGTVINSKTGVHIVPANPVQY